MSERGHEEMAYFLTRDMVDEAVARMQAVATGAAADAAVAARIEAYWAERAADALTGYGGRPRTAEERAARAALLEQPFAAALAVPAEHAPLFALRAFFNAFVAAYFARDDFLDMHYRVCVLHCAESGVRGPAADAWFLREMMYLYMFRFDGSAREIAAAEVDAAPHATAAVAGVELAGATYTLLPPCLLEGARAAETQQALMRAVALIPYLLRRPDMLHARLVRLYSVLSVWRPDLDPTTARGLLAYLRFFTLTHLRAVALDVEERVLMGSGFRTLEGARAVASDVAIHGLAPLAPLGRTLTRPDV